MDKQISQRVLDERLQKLNILQGKLSIVGIPNIELYEGFLIWKDNINGRLKYYSIHNEEPSEPIYKSIGKVTCENIGKFQHYRDTERPEYFINNVIDSNELAKRFKIIKPGRDIISIIIYSTGKDVLLANRITTATSLEFKKNIALVCCAKYVDKYYVIDSSGNIIDKLDENNLVLDLDILTGAVVICDSDTGNIKHKVINSDNKIKLVEVDEFGARAILTHIGRSW